MADKKSTPKFNLVKKTVTASEASPEPLDTEEQPASPSKLSLKESGPEKPSAPQASEEIEVTKLLDDAYAPEEKRRQKSILATRIRKLSLILAASALSIFLMYAYAHIWQKWPLLDEVTWYIPFVASIFIALFACAKAFSILSKERSYIMAATGLCIAGALTYWNAIVLEVAAQPEHYAPDNLFWESEDELERLLAYEINACRGWSLSPAPYVQISEDRYKKAFRARPRIEWKPYFYSHLNSEELSKTTPTNIDLQMRVVSQRMLQKRTETWNNFDAQYQDPDYSLRLKRVLMLPYVLAFKFL